MILLNEKFFVPNDTASSDYVTYRFKEAGKDAAKKHGTSHSHTLSSVVGYMTRWAAQINKRYDANEKVRYSTKFVIFFYQQEMKPKQKGKEKVEKYDKTPFKKRKGAPTKDVEPEEEVQLFHHFIKIHFLSGNQRDEPISGKAN